MDPTTAVIAILFVAAVCVFFLAMAKAAKRGDEQAAEAYRENWDFPDRVDAR